MNFLKKSNIDKFLLKFAKKSVNSTIDTKLYRDILNNRNFN